MKDRALLITILYGMFMSSLCLWLLNENNTLKETINEEIEIKYEYSLMIDSLSDELEIQKHWYVITENELQHK